MNARSRLRLLACVLFGASVARAGVVEMVPAMNVPLAPTPVIAQLRADLAAVGAPATLALPPSAVALSPAAWANLQQVVSAAPVAAAAAPMAIAAGPNGTSAAARGGGKVETDAVKRLSVAQEILGKYDPAEFAKLPAARQDAALAELWDGWRGRGLVDGPADAGAAADAVIAAGVDDKALTFSNKSIFLGAGVLGYPLEDSLWLSRTRISDAIDENALHYPSGQRWRTDDGTPEFLGTGARGQALVDSWGAATDAGRAIVRQVQRGSHELPAGAAVTPAAAAGFARVAAELVAKGDAEALEYLTGRDPTFSAFLLDARKPGYYLYNGDGSVVARIMATDAAKRMGIRRVDHAEGAVVASTYFYRPARVVESLREAAAEAATDSADVRARLAAYAEKLAPSVAAAPAAETSPYVFVAPEYLPGSALDSAPNRYPTRTGEPGRLELPLPLKALRGRLNGGERYFQFSEERWSALEFLLTAIPELAAAKDETVLRFVAEPFQSGGKKIVPGHDRKGVTVQVAVLDEVARLRKSDPEGLKRELRFLSAAFSAALR